MSTIFSQQSTAIKAAPDELTLARRLKRGIYMYEGDELYKRCGCCMEHWPADTDFFWQDKESPDGLNPRCLACHSDVRMLKRQNKNG